MSYVVCASLRYASIYPNPVNPISLGLLTAVLDLRKPGLCIVTLEISRKDTSSIRWVRKNCIFEWLGTGLDFVEFEGVRMKEFRGRVKGTVTESLCCISLLLQWPTTQRKG